MFLRLQLGSAARGLSRNGASGLKRPNSTSLQHRSRSSCHCSGPRPAYGAVVRCSILPITEPTQQHDFVFSVSFAITLLSRLGLLCTTSNLPFVGSGWPAIFCLVIRWEYTVLETSFLALGPQAHSAANWSRSRALSEQPAPHVNAETLRLRTNVGRHTVCLVEGGFHCYATTRICSVRKIALLVAVMDEISVLRRQLKPSNRLWV